MRSDFSQLIKLQKNLETEAKEVDSFLENLTREVTSLFLKEVIDKTPVQSGELQSGWLGSQGTGLRTSVQAFVEGLSLQKEGNAYRILVNNETSYASYVEYGHLLPSGNGFVKGQFFMTKVADGIEREVEALILEQLVLKFAKLGK